MTTGSSNTAFGNAVLFRNESGSYNTAFGSYALQSNTSGVWDTASGLDALRYNTTGHFNTANGRGALALNTSGSYNIAVGHKAGINLTSGDNNISLGNPGEAAESNTIRIGNPTDHTDTHIFGNVHATIVGPSDARFKTNITPLTNVLEKLEQLRGVSFEWNDTAAPLTGHTPGQRDIGVIAQEVEAVFPELLTTWGEEGYRAVAYQKLTGVLLAAVKELKTERDAQQQHIQELKAVTVAMEARLVTLEQTNRVAETPAHLSVFSMPAGWPLWVAMLSPLAYAWNRRKRA